MDNEPKVGVISVNSLDENMLFELSNSINLDYLQKIEGLSEDDIEDLLFEGDTSDTLLMGAWIKNPDTGKYEPDKDSGRYSAICSNMYIQVVWSEKTNRFRLMCSPCYPGQVDLDSGLLTDGYLAYCLP